MNKPIIRSLIVILILISVKNTSAQYFGSAHTIPRHPTVNDSIAIIDSVYTPASGYILYANSITRSNDSFKIINCYYDPSGFVWNGVIQDTFAIGKLSAGVYICTFYSRERVINNVNDPIIPCDSLPYKDTFKFSFTVSQYPNDIYDIHYTNISVAPNPANNKLIISSTLSNIDVAVFDLEGREFNVPHTQNEIDISSLTSGIYCLHIRSKEGSLVRRFVKE